MKKASALVVAVVAAWLVACAAPGEDNNINVLKGDEDSSELQREPYGVATPQGGDLGATNLHPQLVTAPDTKPSLRGLDRSHWSRITVGTADGTTYHHPVFFSDLPVFHRFAVIDDGSSQYAAMEGARAANYDCINILNLVAQPLNVVADMALGVPRCLVQHPWSHVTSP